MTSMTGDSAPLPELTAREIGQTLREVTFGRRITLHSDCDTLDY
jgi:hypothetical protein